MCPLSHDTHVVITRLTAVAYLFVRLPPLSCAGIYDENANPREALPFKEQPTPAALLGQAA
jgi:hypothetical protein